MAKRICALWWTGVCTEVIAVAMVVNVCVCGGKSPIHWRQGSCCVKRDDGTDLLQNIVVMHIVIRCCARGQKKIDKCVVASNDAVVSNASRLHKSSRQGKCKQLARKCTPHVLHGCSGAHQLAVAIPTHTYCPTIEQHCTRCVVTR